MNLNCLIPLRKEFGIMLDKIINLQNQKMSLEKATFEKKELVSKTTKAIIKDSIEDVKIEGPNFSFLFKRKVDLEPTSIFSLVIIFSYSASIDGESFTMMQNEEKSLSDSDFIKIVNNTTIPQNASLIISNLTSINGGNPLITPPIFIK